MANIPNTDSKLVWVKAMARGQCFPLDATEVWTALGDATTEGTATYYAKNDPTAYVGQTLKVVENGEVAVYVISNAAGDLTKLADAQEVADAVGAIDGFATEEYVDELAKLIGDDPVSEQISDAIREIDYPVDSVNGKTGDVQLTASDVGALPSIDNSNNLMIADEAGNVIFMVDENGVHTTALTLNGVNVQNTIDTYILTIDYEKLLACDTTEIVIDGSSSGGDVGNEDAGTSAVLGVAVLGQMVLA